MSPTVAPTTCDGDGCDGIESTLLDAYVIWLLPLWFAIFAAYNFVVFFDGKQTRFDVLGCSPRLSGRRKLVGLAVAVTLLVACNLGIYFTSLTGLPASDRRGALAGFYSVGFVAAWSWILGWWLLRLVGLLCRLVLERGGCRARYLAVDALLFARKELYENQRWGEEHPLTVTTPGGTVLAVTSWGGSWNLNRAVLRAWGKAQSGAKAWRPGQVELYSEGYGGVDGRPGYGGVVDPGYDGEWRKKLLDRPTDAAAEAPLVPRARELTLRFAPDVIVTRTPTEAEAFGLAHPLTVSTLDGSSFSVAGWATADDLYAVVAAAAPPELDAKLDSFYLVVGGTADTLERGFATRSRTQLLDGSAVEAVDGAPPPVDGPPQSPPPPPPPPPPLVLLYHPSTAASQPAQVSVV